MADESGTAVRIAVALDPAAPIESVLHCALSLGGPSASVIGLFVEDTEAADLARSGLALEVTALGESRPLASGRLERQLAARSREVRLSFERGAVRLGVRHTFQVLRGPGIEGLLHSLEQLDLLIVSRAHRRAGLRSWYGLPVHRLAESAIPMILFVQDEWNEGRRVAVLWTGVDAAAPLGAVASRIAAAEALEPLALVPRGTATSAPEGFRTYELEAAEPVAVAAALRDQDVRVLILPRQHELASPARLAELLRRTGSSVLLA